jgi:hypothetical protein
MDIMNSHSRRCCRRRSSGLAYYLGGLPFWLVQSVSAQTTNATNSVAAPTATAGAEGATGLTGWLEQFHWLQIKWLGNPLWQYVAALSSSWQLAGLDPKQLARN